MDKKTPSKINTLRRKLNLKLIACKLKIAKSTIDTKILSSRFTLVDGNTNNIPYFFAIFEGVSPSSLFFPPKVMQSRRVLVI